jgi:hypothetical protein
MISVCPGLDKAGQRLQGSHRVGIGEPLLFAAGLHVLRSKLAVRHRD